MKLFEPKPGQGEEIIEAEGHVSPRSNARRVTLQALYQWQVADSDLLEIVKQFKEDGRLEGADFDLFNELFHEVVKSPDALDELYASYLDRSVSMIDPIEKNILRMGVFELQNKIEIPYRVVINESIELAKRFGAEDSHKYINGILDKVAQTVRSIEFSADNASTSSES